MITSDRGIALIKEYEGLRLETYDDGGGIWTIGVGHTGTDVTPGLMIDEDEAIRLLKSDLATAEGCVDESVEVELSQQQFDALVSLVFNIGCRAFQASTLLRLLNAGSYEAAAKQFQRWSKDNGRVLPGLVRRRAAETELFLA